MENKPNLTTKKSLQNLFADLSPGVPIVEAIGNGSGSGFLLKHENKYLVVTNRHVIENASKGILIHFLTSDGNKQEERFTVTSGGVKVIAIHNKADLAILDVNSAASEIERSGVQPLQLMELSSSPQVGEHIFAIGHPGEGSTGKVLTRTLSDGIVSAIGREYEQATFLQITVPLNPGNSGGPLINDEGKVIGVNTFILRKNQLSGIALQSLNFALECEYVFELLTDKSKSLSDAVIAKIVTSPSQLYDAEKARKQLLRAADIAFIDVESFAKEFSLNSLSAEKKYRGRMVELKGEMLEVTRNKEDLPLILLNTDNRYVVRVFIDPSQVEKFESLKPGDDVIVLSFYSGFQGRLIDLCSGTLLESSLYDWVQKGKR